MDGNSNTCISIITKKTEDEKISYKHILLGILSIVLGWTHEGITFPFACGLIVYSLLNYKTIYKNGSFLLIIGFIIGAFICTFSPATLHRSSFSEGLSIALILTKIRSGFTALSKLKIIYILLALIIIISLKKKNGDFIKKQVTLVSAVFVSVGIVFYSGFTSARAAFGTELYCLILTLTLLSKVRLDSKKLLSGLIVVLVSFYVMIIPSSLDNYKEYKNLVSQITDNSSYIIKTNEKQYNKFINKFILKPLRGENTEWYNSYSSKNWEVTDIAQVYNRDSLAFIPERFYNEAMANPDKYKDFSDYPNLPFYVKEYNGKQPKKVYFILNKTDFSSLPFYIKPFANRMEKYTATRIESDAFDIVNIEGTQYLIVSKNFAVDDRFKNIEVITDRQKE